MQEKTENQKVRKYEFPKVSSVWYLKQLKKRISLSCYKVDQNLSTTQGCQSSRGIWKILSDIRFSFGSPARSCT